MEDGELGLNRVRDVCQKFRILEDQTVAHVLQEQEIEQHLAANELKSRRVRSDVRAARRLQEEEDEWSRQLTRRLRRQIEDMDRDYARSSQDELDRQDYSRYRHRPDREASNRLRWFVGEKARQHEEDEELTEEQSDEGQGIHCSRPRSRMPYVGRGTEEGGGWDVGESRSGGASRHEGGGREPGAGVTNGPGQASAVAQLGTERLGGYRTPGIRHAPRARSADPLESHRTRPCDTDGTPRMVSGKGGGDWKRQCRLDWSYTQDCEYAVPKSRMTGGGSRCHAPAPPNSPGLARPVFASGQDLGAPRHCASDSESQPRHGKHMRDGEGTRCQAGSEVSHGPVRRAWSRCGTRPENVRHKHTSPGHRRPAGEPQTDRRGQLDRRRRAKDRQDPLDPKERPRQEHRQKEENGLHPLAVKEPEKQAHLPLAVKEPEKQAHLPLAINKKNVPHPLAVGEKVVHSPMRSKMKEKQVHFLLAPVERVKPVHWPLPNKGKQVRYPLDLQGKDVHSPLAGKQKRVHFPLAVEVPAQNPLVAKVKDVQRPLTSKEKKSPARCPLAAKGTLIQYRLGREDTEVIIDYLTDKRKESDWSPPRPRSKSPAALGAGCLPAKDRRRPVQPTETRAQDDPAGGPSGHRPEGWTPGTGGQPSPRATNGPKAADRGQGLSNERGEPQPRRAHGNNRDRSGTSKADRSHTRSPLNRRENRPRAGGHRASDTRSNSPNDRTRTPRNGVNGPSWCDDETLKELQAMELRKAQLRKVMVDKKLAQIAQDEEFAMGLLRQEMAALRMSGGQKQPEYLQTAEDSPGMGKADYPRSGSPCSVNVDEPEPDKVPTSTYF